MNRILSIVIVLASFFLLFSFSTESVSQNQDYYERQMAANDIPKVTGKSLDTLGEISSALRGYLKVGDNALLEAYFSKSEVEHMVDVYALFDLMRDVTILLIGLLAICFYTLLARLGWKSTLHSIGGSAIGVLIVLLLLMAVVAMNFHAAWFKFHEIFFSNDLWLMDPEKDLMIQMLPEPFFFGMVKRIGMIMFLGLLALSSLFFIKGERHDYQ